MSGAPQAGGPPAPAVADAKASVTAHFTLHADRGQDVAGAAAELIRRLQEMAVLPQCAYELDVDVQWPQAPVPGGAGAQPGAGQPADSR